AIVGSPPAKASAGGGTSSSKATSGDIVGTLVVPYRGRVNAVVSAAGKVTLERAGKTVRSLPGGHYTVVVVDRSRAAGLTLESGGHRIGLTTRAFTGTRKAVVALDPGTWVIA